MSDHGPGSGVGAPEELHGGSPTLPSSRNTSSDRPKRTRRSLVLAELLVTAPASGHEPPPVASTAAPEPESDGCDTSFEQQEVRLGGSEYLQAARHAFDAARRFVEPLGKSFGAPPPIHFTPSQWRRMQRIAREAGWPGPVIWYVHENVTLEDLTRLGAVSDSWWSKEPAFPRCMPTVSPYDATGYWILCCPIPHPMTLGSTWEEQRQVLPTLAHLLGFRKGEIIAGDATDLAFVMAMARATGFLAPDAPFAVRTDTCVHLAVSSRSWFDHLDMVNVSLIVSGRSSELGDYPNTLRAPFLGMTPMLY